MHKPSMATQAGSVRKADAGGRTAAEGCTEKHALQTAESAEQKMQTWREPIPPGRGNSLPTSLAGSHVPTFLALPQNKAVLERQRPTAFLWVMYVRTAWTGSQFYSSYAGRILGPEYKTLNRWRLDYICYSVGSFDKTRWIVNSFSHTELNLLGLNYNLPSWNVSDLI